LKNLIEKPDMNRLFFLRIIIFLHFLSFIAVNQAFAQMPFRNQNQASVLGWTDDTHYLVRTPDASGKSVIQSVEIKSGKAAVAVMPETAREQLIKSLPSGIETGPEDVTSPDNKSIIIVMENDLYLFSSGYSELR
jgi:hypothetical protein